MNRRWACVYLILGVALASSSKADVGEPSIETVRLDLFLGENRDKAEKLKR